VEQTEFYLEDLKSKFSKINPKEYYLAYSGGKDSELLRWFIKEYLHDTDIEIVSVNTYMEFPDIIENQLKNADVILTPKMKPHEVMEKYGTPCFSKTQDEFINRFQNGSRSPALMERIYGFTFIGKDNKEHSTSFRLNNTAREMLLKDELPKTSNKCCYYLKKKPMKDYEKTSKRKPILGVMGDESKQRKSQYKSCFTKDMKFTPIWDLTEELEDEIIKKYNIQMPKIYEQIHQTGCIGCPYGIYKGDTMKELQIISPARKKYTMKLFGESYKIRGLNLDQMTIFDFMGEDYGTSEELT